MIANNENQDKSGAWNRPRPMRGNLSVEYRERFERNRRMLASLDRSHVCVLRNKGR